MENNTIYETTKGLIKNHTKIFKYGNDNCIQFNNCMSVENNILKVTKVFEYPNFSIVIKSHVYNCDNEGNFINEFPVIFSDVLNTILEEIETLKEYFIKKQ